MTTIVLPISRRDYLKPVFDCLINLKRAYDTELLLMVDGDDSLLRAIEQRLDSLDFCRIQIVPFGDSPAEDIDSRRYRIAAIHNKARYYISAESDYILSIEDDTTYPADTLDKFLYLWSHDTGFIEGVQLGRRNTAYIGGWRANSIYKPTEIVSVLPSKGIEEIDAGGLYCALIDADLYRHHHFEPFDKQGRNGLSCDLNFGLYIKRKGYNCYIDWSTNCDHIGERGSVNTGNTTPRQVRFTKRQNEWEGALV